MLPSRPAALACVYVYYDDREVLPIVSALCFTLFGRVGRGKEVFRGCFNPLLEAAETV